MIGTETAVELELDGYAFIGYIDRLDRDDATAAVTVVDYKTGNIAESADEYRAKVASFVDFQLPFYYWARTAAGDRVTRLALVPLKESAARRRADRTGSRADRCAAVAIAMRPPARSASTSSNARGRR